MLDSLHNDTTDVTHIATAFLIRAVLNGSDAVATTEAIAKQTLALFFEPERGVLPKNVEINLKGLERVIAFISEAGNLKPPLPAAERFVDLQYLQAAKVK